MAACGGASPGDLVSEDLDAYLVERAAEHLPPLTRRSGGGGHGSSDGSLHAQFDRRLETRESVDPTAYASLLATLQADAEAWLTERGYRIAARGTTGGSDGRPLVRFSLRYEGHGAVGWVFVDGAHTEDGRFLLLLSLAEHR